MAKQKDNQKPEDMKPAAENNEAEQQAAEQSPYTGLRMIKPVIREGFMLRKVGQAFMVMPTGPRMKEYQGMITLNETGAFLFKQAQPKEEPTHAKLVKACIEAYGATQEEAVAAVDAFLMQCADCGLMESELKITDRRTGLEVDINDIQQ